MHYKNTYENLGLLTLLRILHKPMQSFVVATRCVHVEVDFVPYSEECLVKETPRTILGHPIFHTYWTDCSVSILFNFKWNN